MIPTVIEGGMRQSEKKRKAAPKDHWMSYQGSLANQGVPWLLRPSFFSSPPAGILFLFLRIYLLRLVLFLFEYPAEVVYFSFWPANMGVPTNNFHELERQRRELEANTLKLQESLYHWRTWEAEYDGLKEEIDDLDENASTVDFLRIGRDFGGDLVNEEEVKVILGAKQGVTRSKEQVVSLISRRIDYVKENVKTIEKRLLTAENQLSGLDAVGQAPPVTDPQLPMTEIMEELDGEGNIVSSSTQTPGSEAPELLNILKRVGAEVPDTQQDTEAETQQSKVEEVENSRPDEKKEEEKVASTPKETTTSPQAPETQPGPTTFTSEARPEIPEEHLVTEVDESPEDAALRREMLEYGMNEIGAVVAELELDENGSDVSYDDGYGTYDEDEEEDEFGRSTGSVLSEDYHKQMRELEERLGAKGMWNMGKDTATLPDEMQYDLDQADEPAPRKEKSKKKVAFADDLDIAPAAEPPSTEKRSLPPQQPDVPTMSDAIIERAEPAAKTPAPAEAPKKTSRFKSARKNALSSEPTTPTPATNISFRPPEVRSTARKSNPSPSLPLFPAKPAEPKPFSQPIADVFAHEKPPISEPQPPQDKILADKLVERDIKEGSAPAPEADEIEDNIHRKEVASEFYRMRNRMIQQNGGFMNNEPETVPLDEDDAPRVSKFKAARMNKS